MNNNKLYDSDNWIYRWCDEHRFLAVAIVVFLILCLAALGISAQTPQPAQTQSQLILDLGIPGKPGKIKVRDEFGFVVGRPDLVVLMEEVQGGYKAGPILHFRFPEYEEGRDGGYSQTPEDVARSSGASGARVTGRTIGGAVAQESYRLGRAGAIPATIASEAGSGLGEFAAAVIAKRDGGGGVPDRIQVVYATLFGGGVMPIEYLVYLKISKEGRGFKIEKIGFKGPDDLFDLTIEIKFGVGVNNRELRQDDIAHAVSLALIASATGGLTDKQGRIIMPGASEVAKAINAIAPGKALALTPPAAQPATIAAGAPALATTSTPDPTANCDRRRFDDAAQKWVCVTPATAAPQCKEQTKNVAGEWVCAPATTVSASASATPVIPINSTGFAEIFYDSRTGMKKMSGSRVTKVQAFMVNKGYMDWDPASDPVWGDGSGTAWRKVEAVAKAAGIPGVVEDGRVGEAEWNWLNSQPSSLFVPTAAMKESLTRWAQPPKAASVKK